MTHQYRGLLFSSFTYLVIKAFAARLQHPAFLLAELLCQVLPATADIAVRLLCWYSCQLTARAEAYIFDSLHTATLYSLHTLRLDFCAA